MKNLINVSNLSDLLQQLQQWKAPVFVYLSCRKGNSTFLVDNVVAKIQASYDAKIDYQKLNTITSRIIKSELLLTEDPILLLVHAGEIKAIFTGIIALHQIEDKLAETIFLKQS
ncbi:MAG: hypothetical protein AAF573_05375 [Bacteroidota bacterium]